MKRVIKIGVFLVLNALFSVLKAQSVEETVYMSEQDLPGSAITKAMGGAQTATNIASATLMNPAIGALAEKSNFTFSPDILIRNNKFSISGTEFSEPLGNFNVSNLSFLLNSNSDFGVAEEDEEQENNNLSFAFGFNLSRMNTFHSEFDYQLLNSKYSITEYFGNEGFNEQVKDGFIDENELSSLGKLAYLTYLTNQDSNGIYSIGIAEGGGVQQTVNYETKGSKNIVDFNFSMGMKDKLFFGSSVGILTYKRNYTNSFFEEDIEDNHPYFKSLLYTQVLESSANGVNMKLGAIYKMNKWLNVSLVRNSSTVFNTIRSYEGILRATFKDHPELLSAQDTTVVVVKKTKELNANYKVKSSSRTTIGASIHNKKIGRLSFDIEYINFSNAKIENISTNDLSTNYQQINEQIDSELQSTFNSKLGGELMIEDNRIRAGLALYSLNSTQYNPTRTYLTFGYGLMKKNYSIDIAYVKQFYKNETNPFSDDNFNLVNKVVGTDVVLNVQVFF